MKNSLAILILVCSSVSALANEWKGPFDYVDFPEFFQAGHEPNNEPIFIGMVLLENLKMKDVRLKKDDRGYLSEPENSGTWRFSGLSKSYRGAKYTHDGKEVHAGKFVMFSPSEPDKYQWVPSEEGKVPENALRAWGEEPQYLCRAVWAGGLFPGRLIPPAKTCLFGFGGIERAVFVYEVLIKMPG